MSHSRKHAPIVGVAWYRAADWNRLRDLSIDRDGLDEAHSDWLAKANRALRQFQRQGQRIRKVVIDIDENLAWCAQHKLPFNSESRARFVADKVRREEQAGKNDA